MGEIKEIAFLCQRLKELREKNNCTMEGMVEKLKSINFFIEHKSSISRVESGKTSEKTLFTFAEKYCEAFGMSELQTKQFLRGEKIAIPDTSALLKNTHLIDELSGEYGKVIIPKVVIDELDKIKNNYNQKYSRGLSTRAWEIINAIGKAEKTISVDYTGTILEDNEDCKIIYVAQEASDKYHCKVDIITEDVDYSAYLKGNESVAALHLREYMATRQGIINMDRLMRVNNYYADSYDNAEIPSSEEVNAYLPDGTTLLISCVRNFNIPLNQRKEKIKWLIAHGADVNRRECSNKHLPALSYAIQMKGQYDMFVFLLEECNADPNAGSRNPYGAGKVRQKNEGNMPLMIAAWWGKEDYVKKLCAHERISINQQDENGFTALIKACANGHIKCRKILMDAGADTRIVDIDGKNYEDHYNEYLELGPLRTRFKRNKKDSNRKGK